MTSKSPPIILAQGKYLSLVKQGHWEFADRPHIRGAVVIVAVSPEQKLILVEQYRIPVSATVIELPAGLVGDDAGFEDEPLESAARRELIEETGYEATDMTLLSAGPPTAGLSSEIIHLYRATGLKKVSDGGGDDRESITVHEVPFIEAHDWLDQRRRAGKLIDPKVYAGLYFLSRD